MWRLRRAFWNWLLTFKYRHNKPLVVPPPVAGERPIEPVPLTSVSAYPIAGIVVADHVPEDEVETLPLRFCQLQAGLYHLFLPMQPGVPEIDANPRAALQDAYTPADVRCFPAPTRPPEYDGDIDLGHVCRQPLRLLPRA